MKKSECVFCKLEENLFNTKLLESEYFYVVPTKGSLVPNYLLIVSKRHINSMSELNDDEFADYIDFLDKLIDIFKSKFNQHPIIFEHGCPNTNQVCSNSITHAHTHILNFRFKNKQSLLDEIKLCHFNFLNLKGLKDNYIYYKDNFGKDYISFEFPHISQLMRVKIAEDLNIVTRFNWKKDLFVENVINTLKNFKN